MATAKPVPPAGASASGAPDIHAALAGNHLRLITRGMALRDALIALFDEFGAAVAPCNSIAEIFDDEHFKARENIVAVADDELGEPIRMQNVVGKLSRTPGEIRHAGPKLGSSNRDVLIDQLGFDEAELKAAGLPLD